MEKHHDLANDPLVGPARRYLLSPLFADAIDFFQASGGQIDHIEHVSPKSLDQPACVDGPDALDHSRAEVSLNASEGVRRRNLDKHRAELAPVFAVGDPPSRSRCVLAWSDRRRMPDHRDEIALALDLQPQNTKAAFGIVKGHALDQAAQLIHCRLRGGVIHVAREVFSAELLQSRPWER
jgi:hypothetical protein